VYVVEGVLDEGVHHEACGPDAHSDTDLAFLEDIWSRNLLNLMVTPIREVEYVGGVALFGMVKLFMGVGVMVIGALMALRTCGELPVKSTTMPSSVTSTATATVTGSPPTPSSSSWSVKLVRPLGEVISRSAASEEESRTGARAETQKDNHAAH